MTFAFTSDAKESDVISVYCGIERLLDQGNEKTLIREIFFRSGNLFPGVGVKFPLLQIGRDTILSASTATRGMAREFRVMRDPTDRGLLLHIPRLFELMHTPWFAETGDGYPGFTPAEASIALDWVKYQEKGSVLARDRLLKRLFRFHFDRIANSERVTHRVCRGDTEYHATSDNMDLIDICPLLQKLDALCERTGQARFSHETDEWGDPLPSLWQLKQWVFAEADASNAIAKSRIESVFIWNDQGAVERTPYPGRQGSVHWVDWYEPPQGEFENAAIGDMFEVGYGKPPKQYQFRKGQSGNPKGRPRAQHPINKERPHLFDELVNAVVDGREVKITRAEQFMRQVIRQALDERDTSLLHRLEQKTYELRRAYDRQGELKMPIRGYQYSESDEVTRIDIAIRHLRLARVMYPKATTARWALEPWFVTVALERMTSDKASRSFCVEVMKRTRCAHYVDWPDWWPDDLKGAKSVARVSV